jgi:hypothetical protein
MAGKQKISGEETFCFPNQKKRAALSLSFILLRIFFFSSMLLFGLYIEKLVQQLIYSSFHPQEIYILSFIHQLCVD